MKPHLWLIRLLGVIVPQRLRADWRQEWEAELHSREELLAEWDRLAWRGRFDLLRRSTSAFWDALVLQPRRLEDEMFQDLRFGFRMLLKQPGFTLIAVLTLALGIGANTAIFSVIQAVLLNPLPYPQSERIVALRVGSQTGGAERPLSPREFIELGKRDQVFDHWSVFEMKEFLLTGGGASEQMNGRRVSAELLSLLGVQPNPGRAFTSEEFQSGHEQVVLLSHGLWQTRYGSDPMLVGQAVTINQKSYTVIGILPSGFNFFPGSELLVPLVFDAEDLANPYYFGFNAFARLKPGISIDRAQLEINMVAPRFERFDPFRFRLYPLHELIVQDFRRTLFLLWGVVAIVLLIACANFANLLLARAANRRKEIAIRMAVGARRGRVVRQLLTESVLLALLGGAIGLGIAYLGSDALAAAGPVNLSNRGPKLNSAPLPELGGVAINGWVIAFTFGVSLLTGIMFGLAPALHLSKPELNSFLKEPTGSSDAGFRLWRRHRLQGLLVVTEVALALVLLVGAGLFVKSFWRSQQVKPGFQPDKLLSIQLQFPWYKYRAQAKALALVDDAVRELQALPGVQSVSAATTLPFSGEASYAYFKIEGREPNPNEVSDLPMGVLPPPPPTLEGKPSAPLWARRSNVGPRYFQTMKIPVQQGREFNQFDNHASANVAIISEGMAQRYWPKENPIGKRIMWGRRGDPLATIVGVVGNSVHNALEGKTPPMLYLPLNQYPRRKSDGKESEAILQGVDTLHLVVRTAGRPEDMVQAAKKQLRILDPDQPLQRFDVMEEKLTKAIALPRFNMILFGVFAGAALLLALIGVYGLMAYLVVQRTHEIGVRLALGAQNRDVLQLLMTYGMKLAVMGVALGIAASFGLTRLIKSWLFGVSTTDPLIFSGIVALLTFAMLAACYLPARRASKVDPLIALRHE
jgi:putative ABC transport system permease protein